MIIMTSAPLFQLSAYFCKSNNLRLQRHGDLENCGPWFYEVSQIDIKMKKFPQESLKLQL